MKNQGFLIAIILLLLQACSPTQVNQALKDAKKALEMDDELTREEVAAGLKEALIQGITEGAQLASKTNGYYKNPAIKIPLPPEIRNIESDLRRYGFGNQVDQFLVSLNRGAEKAANEARPIFVNAIRGMSIQDAWEILRGSDNAATQYLRGRTVQDLYNRFLPVVQRSLEQVEATRYYTDIVNAYNKVPGVQKINADLDDYATNKAIDGLFYLIAKEEKAIRQNPAERTTDLLRKVFGELEN